MITSSLVDIVIGVGCRIFESDEHGFFHAFESRINKILRTYATKRFIGKRNKGTYWVRNLLG